MEIVSRLLIFSSHYTFDCDCRFTTSIRFRPNNALASRLFSPGRCRRHILSLALDSPLQTRLEQTASSLYYIIWNYFMLVGLRRDRWNPWSST